MTANENPFRVVRIEALAYRLPEFCWDGFLGRLEAADYRGAIVGPHGSGKTTLLLEAQRRLRENGVPVFYGFLNEETTHKAHMAREFLREIPGDAVLFLDGAEQLNAIPWSWLRWRSRQCRGLVITAHAPGRMPTLYTTRVDVEVLKDLLGQLVPETWEQYWPQAQMHFARCNGNIRDVFFALYDDCARSHPRP